MLLTLSPAKTEETNEDRPPRKQTIRINKAFEATVTAKKGSNPPIQTPKTNTALVSWYGYEACSNINSCHTANGDRFYEDAFTIACVSDFALGTIFVFKYGGNTVKAKCTDRGAFAQLGRTFDLSKGTFKELAPLSRGVINVSYYVIY